MITVGIIPLRSGSKRFPGKNFKRFKDTTLLKNTIDKLSDAKVNKICISTDKIVLAKETLGLDFDSHPALEFIKRPENISNDDSKTEDVVLHAIDYLNIAPDHIIVVSQVTTPNWSPHHLSYAIHKLVDGKYDSVIGVSPDLKPNGSFYVFKNSTFLEHKKIYMPNMYLVKMSWEESIDIDFDYQLYLAESISRGNYDSR